MTRIFSTFVVACVVIATIGANLKIGSNLKEGVLPHGDPQYPPRREELPPKGGAVGINGIPLKVVIAEPTPYFSVPNSGGTSVGTYSMFQILYVMKTSDSFISGNKTNEWLKVSPTQHASDAVWIQAMWSKNVFRWPHRVCWYPLKTSAVFQSDVFASFEDIERSIKGQYVSPIGSVRLRNSRLSENPWPILESKRVVAADGTSYWCYHVAFLGRLENKSSADDTTSRRSYTREETHAIINQLRTIDCLVALDVTSSMDPHFVTAQNAIREFAATFAAKNLNARFKLTTFKDIDEIHHYPWESIDDFCNRVSRQIAEGGGDDEESVYPALHEALSRTTFRERSERILLLVGDAPSHVSGVNNPNRIGNYEIIRLSTQNNVKFFVAAVSEGRALERQMRGIADATGGKSIALTNKSELFRHIRQMLEETSDRATVLARLAEGTASGKSKRELDEEIGTDTAPLVRILETEKRIDVDKLAALKKGDTICATGWIMCPDNAATAGRLEVFGTKTEFQATLGVMQTIVTLAPEHKTMLDIQIEGFGARVRTDVPIGQFMEEYGLPHTKPSLVGMTFGEIMVLTEAQRASIKDTLESKIRRLKEELNDKSRWRVLSPVDERIIGYVSENCLL